VIQKKLAHQAQILTEVSLHQPIQLIHANVAIDVDLIARHTTARVIRLLVLIQKKPKATIAKVKRWLL
jgi:uncharacterized protein YueI